MVEQNGEADVWRKYILDESKIAKIGKFIDRHYRNLSHVGVKKIPYQMREIHNLMDYATATLVKESSLLEIDPPVTVVGDIHGQFNDLIRMFATLGPPPKRRYVFLGDYVDRGRMGLETIVLLMAYKVLFPKDIFLLRGNHECQRINERYGFLSECLRIFNSKKVYRKINSTFEFLPLSALIGGQILCMHGGLSPKLKTLQDIKSIARPIFDPQEGEVVNDILWSDPEVNMSGWDENTRGTSYIFGKDIVDKYCEALRIQLIARAHQVCEDGYRFFANKKLITIFSAPNYCGDSGNSGAVMEVTQALGCNIHTFQPRKKIPHAGNTTMELANFQFIP